MLSIIYHLTIDCFVKNIIFTPTQEKLRLCFISEGEKMNKAKNVDDHN